MPTRIVFRTGSAIPSTEYLEVGEPIFDPDKLRFGIGAGNDQPLWYPRINPLNQDLILFGSSLIQSEAGGHRARFGFEAADQFNLYTFSGIRVRIADQATTFYNRVNLTAGGTLSGDVNTDGGRFTDMNVRRITTSAVTGHTAIHDGQSGTQVGRIDARGVTSLAQQETYLTLAMMTESWTQFMRNTFSSGIVAVRQYNAPRPFDPKYKTTTGGFSAMSIHNHMDWRGVCGMAEISVLINGYHIQTRHNDYRMMRPLATNTFGERALNTGAPVPQSVRNMPLGYTGLTLNGGLAGTQVEWMRNVHTLHKEHCVFELAYLEAWVQKFDGNLLDVASSTRHSNEQRLAKRTLEQVAYYNRSGIKLPSENLPTLPGLVMTHDANGQPVLGYVNWRISSIPVANPSNNNVSTTIDGVGYDLRALPFDAAKAGRGEIDATNRFRVRRNLAHRHFKNRWGRTGGNLLTANAAADLFESGELPSWEDLIFKSNNTLFDCADLEELCRMVPGFDGVANYASQYLDDPNGYRVRGTLTPVRFSAPNQRGLGYYHNAYNINTNDASGFSATLRGFSDQNLFTAQTRHPDVLGGWTYMIPLELVLRTPRENWNPFNVVQQNTPTGNGTYNSPYSGWSEYGQFFTIPVDSLVVGSTVSTQADTTQRAFMSTPSGVKEMWASGVRIFDFTGERRRFPVVPESIQFTGVGRDLEWFKLVLKGLLKRVASGNVTSSEIDEAF